MNVHFELSVDVIGLVEDEWESDKLDLSLVLILRTPTTKIYVLCTSPW